MRDLDVVKSVDVKGDSVVSRKRNLLLFFVVLLVVSFSPMSIAGTTLWDIQSGVFFRGSGDGAISLNAAGTASQIRIVSGVVEFTSLTVGGGSIVLVGFNASSNAAVTIADVGLDRITYNVDATAGVTTTVVVKAPPDRTVTRVDGADSFAFDGDTDLVTVTDIQGAATGQFIVWLNPVSGSFAQTIRTLADILLLVGFVMGIVLAAEVAKGNFFTGTSMTLIGFIIGTTVAIMILTIAERLFN